MPCNSERFPAELHKLWRITTGAICQVRLIYPHYHITMRWLQQQQNTGSKFESQGSKTSQYCILAHPCSRHIHQIDSSLFFHTGEGRYRAPSVESTLSNGVSDDAQTTRTMINLLLNFCVDLFCTFCFACKDHLFTCKGKCSVSHMEKKKIRNWINAEADAFPTIYPLKITASFNSIQ